jgi:hypothetical protein
MASSAHAVIDAPLRAGQTKDSEVPVAKPFASTKTRPNEASRTLPTTASPVEYQRVNALKLQKHNGLLLKSLQALKTVGTRQADGVSGQAVVGLSQVHRAQPTPQGLDAEHGEHIDPLPEFSGRCSIEQDDHCVIVGKAGTSAHSPETASSAALASSGREEASGGMDRRAYPRRESDGFVTVCRRSSPSRLHCNSPELPWKIHASTLKGALIDVSVTGIALSLSEPLPTNAPLLLQVSSRHLAEPLEVAGSVLRCTALDGGQWRIICQLESRLTFEQVHLLGKQMFACAMV